GGRLLMEWKKKLKKKRNGIINKKKKKKGSIKKIKIKKKKKRKRKKIKKMEKSMEKEKKNMYKEKKVSTIESIIDLFCHCELKGRTLYKLVTSCCGQDEDNANKQSVMLSATLPKGQSERQHKQAIPKKRVFGYLIRSKDGVVNAMISRSNEVWTKISIDEYFEQQMFHDRSNHGGEYYAFQLDRPKGKELLCVLLKRESNEISKVLTLLYQMTIYSQFCVFLLGIGLI
ncbi:hypothetical protein RFI_33145, partial [Reticulomyxa filosa]